MERVVAAEGKAHAPVLVRVRSSDGIVHCSCQVFTTCNICCHMFEVLFGMEGFGLDDMVDSHGVKACASRLVSHIRGTRWVGESCAAHASLNYIPGIVDGSSGGGGGSGGGGSGGGGGSSGGGASGGGAHGRGSKSSVVAAPPVMAGGPRGRGGGQTRAPGSATSATVKQRLSPAEQKLAAVGRLVPHWMTKKGVKSCVV